MIDRQPETPSSLMRRWKLVLWSQHQPYFALLLMSGLIGMSLFFGYRYLASDGLQDIDEAQKTPVAYKVDINTAQWPEIVVLPGVGEKLARAIVEFRQQHGPFSSWEEIQDVAGIGKNKLELLKPFLLPIER